MSRRKLILEEMGLAPVWRLRADALPGATGTAVEQEPDRAHTPPPTGGGDRERPGAPARAPAPGDVPAAQARPAPLAPAVPDSRRDRILQMDWAALRDEVSACRSCRLHEQRHCTVFGVGDERADWLFVGEGPGAEEDQKGEPFVGQAGRLLDNMLAAIGLARGQDVYIANVVKCRPPGNRNPEPDEMQTCEPYLTRQIELIRPRLIVAMGRIAATHLLATGASIASLRGRVHDYRGTPLIVTYHPAYLLRNLPDKAKAWADLCFARETMAAAKAGSG